MPARREKVDVSLFPFLSVLCTVIAVMVMMGIMILNTRVVAQQAYKRVQDGVAAYRPGTQNAQSDGVDSRRLRQMEEEVARLNDLLKKRKEQLADVTRKFKALQDLIVSKEILLELEPVQGRGQELAAPEPVVMVPREGPKHHLNPILVEIEENRYVVHPSKQPFPAMKLGDKDDPERIAPNPALREFLKDIDKRRNRDYLVFLVHPGGADAFYGMRVYLLLRHPDLPIGWEPFPKDWKQMDSREE
jgi:hypothetical protein